MQLRDARDQFESADLQIVGISFDSVEILKTFSDAEQIPFLLLSDEGSQTIREYGLHFQRGLPHPGTIVVDRDGVIRAKLFQEGYVTRHTIDELVTVAAELND